MQDKKVIALIILAILAVISLIYGVTASPKTRVKSAAVSQSQTVTPSPNVASVQRRARRSQFKVWKKSPFARARIKPEAPKFVLNGIIWSDVKPRAMIGNTMVVKGDTIDGNKVIDIRPGKVILSDGTKNFELEMEK